MEAAIRSLVPDELVALSRGLGDPAHDLAILAEGNASMLLPDDRLAVKVSGRRMEHATADDFLIVDMAPLVRLIDDPSAAQADLSAALGGEGRPAASIETLVHVAAMACGGARVVAHTHPTDVVGLLCTDGWERLFAAPFFPDEAVVLGRPAFVPYAEPGLALGRAVAEAIRDHVARERSSPRLVLLGNHGIVALGATTAEVWSITLMCVKAARVRRVALGAGTATPLDVHHAYALAARPDEAARSRGLRGAPR